MNSCMANKLDNLEEIKKFLEAYNLPSLNQVKTDNLNRLITISEIQFVIKKKKNSQQTKVQDQMASQGNSTKHIKEN